MLRSHVFWLMVAIGSTTYSCDIRNYVITVSICHFAGWIQTRTPPAL